MARFIKSCVLAFLFLAAGGFPPVFAGDTEEEVFEVAKTLIACISEEAAEHLLHAQNNDEDGPLFNVGSGEEFEDEEEEHSHCNEFTFPAGTKFVMWMPMDAETGNFLVFIGRTKEKIDGYFRYAILIK